MIAIVGGSLHTICHGVLPGHSLLVRDGTIEALLPPGPIPPGYETLDASGKAVLPGFVDARTSVGLYGDGGGYQNADHEELTDPDVAWVRAVDAFNPGDAALADAREAGITCLLAGPGTTNVAGGLSAVVKTAGRTAREMVLREPAGLHLGLGRPPVDHYRDKNKIWTRMGVVGLLRERLTAARVKLRKAEAGDSEPDFRLEPYVRLLRREYPARARVATAADAWTALRLADEFGFDLVLEQLTEGHLAGLPEELARRRVPCVVGPLMKAGKTHETRRLTLRTAAALAQAGVPVALCTGHPSRPIWSLRLEAGLAVRAGLDAAHALRAITLNAAAALGVEERVGSLEPGKDADLVVIDGDPLHPASRVSCTLVGGRVVYPVRDPS